MEARLKNLIVTVVEVAKATAPEVPKNAITIESSVDLPAIAVIPKIHVSVKVDMSKL